MNRELENRYHVFDGCTTPFNSCDLFRIDRRRLQHQTDITGAQASSYPHAITSDSIDDVQATVRAIFFRPGIYPSPRC
jgi:hypothetical protein